MRSSWTASAGRPARSRADDEIEQRGGRADRRRPGAQHAGVARLDELRRDVDDDVRARLEVRADHADGAPPLLDDEVAGQGADGATGRQGRGFGEYAQLAGHVGEPGSGQLEPVDEAGGHAVFLRGGDVGRVRGKDLVLVRGQQVGHREDRGVDLLLGGGGERGARSGRMGGGLCDGGSGVVLVHRRLRGSGVA